MEPIEVTARFNLDGEIAPLSFRWKGGEYRIESTGRRWTDEEGRHFLVMVPPGHVYELLFSTGSHWYIRPIPGGRQMA